MKLPNEDEIEFYEVPPDGFHKGLAAGEILPHDVEIIVKFRNGDTQKINIDWRLIVDLSKRHGVSAIKEMYESIVYL